MRTRGWMLSLWVVAGCGDDGASVDGTDTGGTTAGETTFSSLDTTATTTTIGPADTSTSSSTTGTTADTSGSETTTTTADGSSTGEPVADPLGDPIAVDLGVDFVPLSLEPGDFDGDGAVDLLVAGTDQGTVVAATYLGAGDGGLAAPIEAGITACSAFGVVGAIDDDGHDDVFFGTCVDEGRFFLGGDDGTFAPVDVLDPWAAAAIVASTFGDVQSDGSDDLVVMTVAGGLALHIADGSGAAPWPVTTHDLGIDLAANRFRLGHLDAGGTLDAVVVATDDALVVAMDIDGDPVATPIDLAVAPWSVALGDLDGDGDLDLVVASRTDSAIQVLLGDGGGGFDDAGTLAVDPLVPLELVLGDLDGDGVLDVAVIDGVAPAVAYALGDGAGGFGPWWSRELETIAVRLHARDLDGDGRDDLIAATFATGSFTVLPSG